MIFLFDKENLRDRSENLAEWPEVWLGRVAKLVCREGARETGDSSRELMSSGRFTGASRTNLDSPLPLGIPSLGPAGVTLPS